MKKYCDCGKLAIWCYLPGFGKDINPYACDDCVPRGCSCNQEWVDEDYNETGLLNQNQPTESDKPYIWVEEGKIWSHVDEQYREPPCCEWGYDINKNNFKDY